MNRAHSLTAAALFATFAACHSEATKTDAVKSDPVPTPPAVVPVADPHPVASAKASDATFPKALGAAIEEKTDTGTLTSIAKNVGAYKGKTVATSGTVKAVCQHMGCWMELTDGTKSAMIRMHDHAFFVPKTANGHKARVEGKLVLMKDGKECDDMSASNASMELDATGVEIL